MSAAAAVLAGSRGRVGEVTGAALPGFEHVRRYYDSRIVRAVAKILPGEFYVSDGDDVITTVLGSCVAACIRDRENGVGGMNHFMLPAPAHGNADSWRAEVGRAARYGTDAMEHLVNAILKAGGRRERLEVKIFGGARGMSDVGRRNVEFVRHYLHTEGLMLVAEHVGDVFPRQVQYFPDTGRARMRRLRAIDGSDVTARESAYLKELANHPIKGAVELF